MNDNAPIIACTHSEIFHSDEVMACALLRLAAGSAHVSIIRSRLSKDWDRADYVIDVGGKFDGIKFFDHHQPDYDEKRPDGTGYSSFGLLWNSIGITALRELLLPYNLDDTMIVEVAGEMDNFVKGIDLHDQAQLNVNSRWSLDKTIYAEVATLQGIISSMNPIPFIDSADLITINTQFYAALDLATNFLKRFIFRKASKIIATKYVTSRIHMDSNVLYLEEYCDWYEAVSKAAHVLYVVYPSSNGKAFVVQCVKSGSGSSNIKNLKVPFPANWAGLNNEELVGESGVEGALFCHRDRFIASASTLEGAYSLIENSLKSQHETDRLKQYGPGTGGTAGIDPGEKISG